MKKFVGWQVVKSKTGSDWGHQQEWPSISPILKTKKEAVEFMHQYRSHDCMPRDIVKRYKDTKGKL